MKVLIFFTFTFALAASESTQCPLNQEYTECGSACPPTCKDLGIPKMCTMQCVPGCFCKSGLVKDDSGNCIDPQKCPGSQNQCPQNQEFKECGTACPPTCENQNPQICTMQCVQGCFCKSGLVKDKSGNCINPKSCPAQPKCPVNQEFQECGTACPPTCDNQNPQICTMQCVRGCFCKSGLVKDKSGNCIDPKSCPGQPKCPANQEFKECGTACPPTCDNQNPQICTMQCVRGCFCKAGFVKDKAGNCINPKLCPAQPQCPLNQEFKECGSACPPTCKNPNPVVCTEQCVRGCFCKAGLVKDDSGNCINPKACPASQQCPSNQEFQECGSACPPSCKTQKPQACTLQCVPGCFCKAGLVKDESGNCIDSKLCPGSQDQCPSNREFKECGTACPPTCKNPNPQVCTAQCVRGCFCKSGLVEDDLGQCINPKNCISQNKCGENEQWSNATCVAPASCQTPRCPNGVNVLCSAVCLKGGCVCKDGFYRNSNAICVRLDQCNVKVSTPKPVSG